MPPKKAKKQSKGKKKAPSPPPVEIQAPPEKTCSFKFPPGSPFVNLSPSRPDEFCLRTTSIEDLLFTDCLVPYKEQPPCVPDSSPAAGVPVPDTLNKPIEPAGGRKTKSASPGKAAKKEKKPAKQKGKTKDKKVSSTAVAETKPPAVRRPVPRKCFCCKKYLDRTQSESDLACADCSRQEAIWTIKYHFTRLELGELLEAFYFFAVEDKPKTVGEEVDASSKKGAKNKGGGAKAAKTKDKGKKNKGKDFDDKKNPADGKSVNKEGTPDAQSVPEPPQLGLSICAFSRCLRTIGQNPSEGDLAGMFNMAGPEPIRLERYLDIVDCWSVRSLAEMEADLWEAFKVLNCDSNEWVLVK